MNSSHVSRRRFLTQLASGVAAAPFVTSNLMAASPNSKINHASIGASGMAWADIANLSNHPMLKLVAVADVDTRNFDKVKKKFPNARLYQDWRELLAKEGDKIDSINISTPDHMHGAIGMTAMAMGKNIYGQKPLAQTIHECRAMVNLAQKKNIVTQMGIQISSTFYERAAVKMIQDGLIGKVKEVHTFSNKKWGDTSPLPDTKDSIPTALNWDQWLGVASERPYIKGYYHPKSWRKRRDFGTGTLGDMGCHMFSGWHRALNLTAPTFILSRGPRASATNWAINEIIDYTYPGTEYTAKDTIKVTWYDGDFELPKEVLAAIDNKKIDQGTIYIGTEGALLAKHTSTPRLFPREKFRNFRYPKFKARNHYHEYVDACLKGKGTKPSANFDYSGPLTESVLLGTLSTIFPNQKLEWDSKNMVFKNSKEATSFVKRTYRKGWEVAGL